MKNLVLILLLLPAVALGQGVRREVRAPFKTLGVSFAGQGCYAASDVAPSFGTVAFARNLAAYYDTGNGTLASCAADRLRVGPGGPVLEAAATNPLQYSQEIHRGSGIPWSHDSITVTANQAAAPDGTTTAELVTEAAASSAHNIRQNYGATAVDWVVSAYVKAGTRSIVWLSLDGGSNRRCFDLATATVGTGGTYSSAGITALASGWFRIWVTKTMGAGTNNIQVGSAAVDCTPVFASDGSGTFYVWNPQVELGTTPTSAILTVNSTTTQRPADTVTFTK